MKEPKDFLTNTLTPAGRELGEAKNNPGDNSGTGVDHETYNDLIYSAMATIQSYKQGGNSGTNETLLASDMRDALEEMTNKKVNGVDDYNPVTNYILPGVDLIMSKGFQFVNILDVTNNAKDPFLFPGSWLFIPSPEELMKLHWEGVPIDGGLNPVSDRASAQYLQHFLYGNYRLGDNGEAFYNFNRVNLDSAVVTGNAELEAIFDVGGGNEYFNLDLIAPDNLGTRTLIDMSSRHIAPQSSGGDNDVLGGVLSDRFESHTHGLEFPNLGGNLSANATHGSTLTYFFGNDRPSLPAGSGSTTRPKEFTVGSSYIIVMIPA